MGQQDLYQSDFFESNRRFADAFNGILFRGEEVMKPEELEAEDSVITKMMPEEKGKKVICDKIRRWRGGQVSILVLENQTMVDYRMVLRVMQSELLGYEKQRRKQYLKNKESYRGSEYISQMKREQKLVPIITLVLYLGKDKPWDGARSLYEMLEIQEGTKPFVNNFKLNLFDYHECKDFSGFKTENRLLFEMLSCEKDKGKMKEMLKERAADGLVDEESAKAILGILNVKTDLRKLIKKDKTGREVYDMCQAFEDYKEEGRVEGRVEGELTALQNAVEKLMENMKISFEEAAKMLGISIEKQNRIRRMG